MTLKSFRKCALEAGSALNVLVLLGGGIAGSLALSTGASAQDYTSGVISGTVTAPDGTPAAGATVTVSSADTGQTRTATTGSNGSFRFPGLAAGTYTVEVEAAGSQPYRAEGLALLASQNASLSIGLSSENAIVVTGSQLATVAAFEGTTTGLNVDVAELVKTVPVSRDLTSVVLLAPGTTKGDAAFGNLASVGGSSVAENAYYINGLNITNFDNYLGSARVPFEMYKSVEVKSGGYPAEFGRATGGIINATTKSGTNDFRAALHLNWEPEFLTEGGKDLTNCFYNNINNPDAGVTCESLTNRRADTASALSAIAEAGGAIVPDRLFVYGLLEMQKTVSNTKNLASSTAIEDVQDDPFWGAKIDAYPLDNHHLEFTIFDTRRTTRRNYNAYTIENGEGLAGSVQDFHRGGISFVGKYTGNLTDFLTVSGAYGKMKDRFDNEGVAGAAALPDVRNTSGATLSYAPGTPGTSGFTFNPATGRYELPYLAYTNGQRSAANSFPYNTEREFYRADADLYFNAFGDHHIRIGFDQEDNTLTEASVRTGGQFLLDNGLITPEAFNAGFGNAGIYYQLSQNYVTLNYFNSSGSFKSRNRAFYAQDEWNVTDRLTLNLGVRRDDFTVKKADGSDYVTQKGNYAPRLGMTFDIFPEMNGRVKAFYGQYYLPFASNTAFRQVGSEIFIRERFTYNGFDGNGLPILTGQWTSSSTYQGQCPITLSTSPFSDGRHCNVTGDGTVAESTALIDANLKATKETEWLLGYEQNIGDWKVGLNYTHRQLDRTAEDVAIDEAVLKYCDANDIASCSSTWTGFHQYVITNPGSPMTVALDGLDGQTVTFSAADLGYPKPTRKYDAVELTFERPFNGTYTIGGSYTWSRSRGNSEGFVQSDFGQDDAGITQDFDQPGFTIGSYGRLPNDRTHRFKFWGSYKFDDRFSLGLNGTVSSPRPLSCFGYDPGRAPFDLWYTPYNDAETNYTAFGNAYGAASHYCGGVVSPRGEGLKTDWISNFDVKVAYELPVGGDRSLTLRADIFNIFNSQGITSRDEVGEIDPGNGPDPANEVSPYLPSPSYGLATGYQTPRYVRLGVDLEF